MYRVLILGSRGMLGSCLSCALENSGYTVIRQSRSSGLDVKLNLLSSDDWLKCLYEIQPDVIVNLAAAVNVDRCEAEPMWAFEGNMKPLIAFRKATVASGVRPHVVHISTDQVYNGTGPHSEDEACPSNVYALTKLGAELLLQHYPATVLRSNFFGLSLAPQRESFSDWIVRSLRSQSPILLFDDVLFSPVHMSTLCEAIRRAIAVQPLGIFNFGSSDGISKAAFGLELASRLGLITSSARIGSVNDLSLKAKRPLDMRMKMHCFEDAFKMKAPSITSEIDKAVSEYQD